MTVSVPSEGHQWSTWARSVMPIEKDAKDAGHDPKLIAALRLSGGLKAGTPFEMASVPVMARAPPREGPKHQKYRVKCRRLARPLEAAARPGADRP